MLRIGYAVATAHIISIVRYGTVLSSTYVRTLYYSTYYTYILYYIISYRIILYERTYCMYVLYWRTRSPSASPASVSATYIIFRYFRLRNYSP